MENTLLNLVPASYLPEVHLSQYDKGRELKFTLKDGSSDYSVPSGAVVTVKATKPSGLGFVVNAVADGNVVTLSNTETMTNENGRFPAELSIVQGQTVIGTSNFIFNIERSPHPEGTIDGDAESLLPELTLLVERIEAAADSVDEDTQTVTEAKAEVLQAKADTLQAKADTLTARDDALQAKADTITAKESAEASAQAAEEASERAEELIGSVETKADAIVKTASGEIASFTDGGDGLPMKSLKVNIVPKQSGSGDPSPSNVRPISGVDTVGVTRAGKILMNPLLYSGMTYNPSVGSVITPTVANEQFVKDGEIYKLSFPTTTWKCYFVLFELKNGVNYRFHAKINSTSTLGTSRVYLDEDMKVFSSVNNTNAYEQVHNYNVNDDGHENVKYWALLITNRGSATDISIENLQMEIGESYTDYEPYEGESKSISLGQTVYDGVLDVVSGKLTLSRGFDTYDGSEDEVWSFTSGRANIFISDAPRGSYSWDFISNYLKPTGSSQSLPSEWQANFNNNGALLIGIPTSIADVSAWRTYLSNNNLQLCYKLDAPIEIQLTPTEVKTLLGANNIWSDSGTVEVEYRADTTLAYNELVAMILENIGN